MGVFSALSRASTVAIRTERGRIHGMGAVTGVYTASFSWGEVLGPLGFGAIAEVWNIPVSFYVGAIVGIVTALAAFWLLHHNQVKG
jgi:MFS family permease